MDMMASKSAQTKLYARFFSDSRIVTFVICIKRIFGEESEWVDWRLWRLGEGKGGGKGGEGVGGSVKRLGTAVG